MNLVIVKHTNKKHQREYIFEVPDGFELRKGNYVQVDTKYGKQFAECVCNSFCIDNEASVRIVIDRVGGKFPLRRVTGKCVVVPLEKVWEAQDSRDLYDLPY